MFNFADCALAQTFTKSFSGHKTTLMGPYPRTSRGKRFVLVVTDLFSRWVEAFPLGTSTTNTITKVLEDEVFSRWGYSSEIISDNGPQFGSEHWQVACEKWQTTPWTTRIYHPQANVTERRNQEIKKGLRPKMKLKQSTNCAIKKEGNPYVVY